MSLGYRGEAWDDGDSPRSGERRGDPPRWTWPRQTPPERIDPEVRRICDEVAAEKYQRWIAEGLAKAKARKERRP